MRDYVKPMMDSEVFASNEYCSTCGDVTSYLFNCDAGSKTKWQDVYVESNGIDGLQTRSEWIQTGEHPLDGYLQPADTFRTGSYHACGATHEAPTTDEFLDGYVINGRLTIPVKIWTDHGTNTHCTTNINEGTWPIAKS